MIGIFRQMPLLADKNWFDLVGFSAIRLDNANPEARKMGSFFGHLCTFIGFFAEIMGPFRNFDTRKFFVPACRVLHAGRVATSRDRAVFISKVGFTLIWSDSVGFSRRRRVVPLRDNSPLPPR